MSGLASAGLNFLLTLKYKELFFRLPSFLPSFLKSLTMASNFYAKWVQSNAAENQQLLQQVTNQSDDQQLTGGSNEQNNVNNRDSKPSDITYKSDKFQLIIEEKSHSRQKMFKIQDALFVVRVIPLTDDQNPLLIDLLTFLRDGFDQILIKLKKFFKPSDHRIAYLTLYQEPMVITHLYSRIIFDPKLR